MGPAVALASSVTVTGQNEQYAAFRILWNIILHLYYTQLQSFCFNCIIDYLSNKQLKHKD